MNTAVAIESKDQHSIRHRYPALGSTFKRLKVNGTIAVNGIPMTYIATGCHLPYGITKCYLRTSERVLL